jgi:signal transduction histidine kinase
VKSIRQELTVRLLAGTSLLLILASVVLCFLVWSILLNAFDDNLLTKAKTINALTMREGDLIESEFHEDTMPEFSDEENPEFFQIVFQDGTVINRSESMEDMVSPVPRLGDELEAIGNILLEDGENGRYILLKTKPIKEEEIDKEEEVEADEIIFTIPESIDPETATVTIFVAKSREDLDQMLGYIYLIIGGIDLMVLLGIYLLVKVSIRKGMAPIDEINTQIAEIDTDELEKRIKLESPPNELSTIIGALNDLLDKMEQVITRERRFTSDVAHELRTPVSELRSAGEVGRLSLEDPESTKLFFDDVTDIAVQMEKIVNNLLSLSRWDQEIDPVKTEEVDLGTLVDENWERLLADAQEKEIKLDCRIKAGTKLFTDREKFEMIVRNLLENAIAYSVPGSRIRCRLEPGNPSVHLIFENQATNLCQEDVNHLFDRFWRKDKARSEVNHSGLGLSIVKALADLLKIELKPELLDGNWFRMQLKIRI